LKRISVNSFTADTRFLNRVLSDNFSVSDVVPQLGGETYEIRRPARDLFLAVANDITADKNEIITI